MDALAGCDRIIHAGDIGRPGIIETLSEIAAVTAVRGNVDTGDWARTVPEEATVEVESHHLLVIHDRAQLVDAPPQGCSGVISGHSHRPMIEHLCCVLYFNPGAAGPRRFRLPVTVGLMHISRERIRAEVVELTV